MKSISAILVLAILFLSCSQEENLPYSKDVVGEWALIKTHDRDNQIVKEGDGLERKESYIFSSDGSFTKSITENGITKTASGTFHTEEAPLYISRTIKVMLKLKFKRGQPIYASCQADHEDLEISAQEGLLMNYVWGPCDRLIFTYEKI